MAKKDRDRLIRTFQKRTGPPPPRARKNVRPKFIPVDQGYNPDKMVSTNPMREATDATAFKNKRAGRVSTVFPRDLMYGSGKVPRGSKQVTFSRSNSGEPPGSYYREDDPRWVSPRVIPGYGQVRNKQKPRVRRTVGNPEGIPPRTRYSYPHGPTMRTPGAVSLRRRQRKYN